MQIGSLTELSSVALHERFDTARWLDRYLDQLAEENERLNLVSRETSRADLVRLALDSLVPLALFDLPGSESYLDIGSGGGFPAFPLLLCGEIGLAPDSRPVLVERIAKKSAALRRMAIALGLKIDPIASDLAQAKLNHTFDLITMRFVKLTTELLSTITPLLSHAGRFVYYAKPEFEPDPECFTCNICPYTIDNSDQHFITLIERLRA